MLDGPAAWLNADELLSAKFRDVVFCFFSTDVTGDCAVDELSVSRGYFLGLPRFGVGTAFGATACGSSRVDSASVTSAAVDAVSVRFNAESDLMTCEEFMPQNGYFLGRPRFGFDRLSVDAAGDDKTLRTADTPR